MVVEEPGEEWDCTVLSGEVAGSHEKGDGWTDSRGWGHGPE